MNVVPWSVLRSTVMLPLCCAPPAAGEHTGAAAAARDRKTALTSSSGYIGMFRPPVSGCIRFLNAEQLVWNIGFAHMRCWIWYSRLMRLAK